MTSLTFAVKFSLTFVVLGLHLALFVLLVISLAIHSGSNTEAIALGIEAVQLVLISIRLYYYFRYRNAPSRLKHEPIFFVSLWLISLSAALWISIRSPGLLKDFSGLSYPEVAAIVAITFTWLAWTLTVHLIWIAVQDHEAGLDQQDELEPVPWPSYTSPSRISRPKRISAKVVAVAHGSDPLLWARKKDRHGQGPARTAGVQPAKPTYNPHDRQPAIPPHTGMKTTYNQWYLGEAV
ncbi:hypothetical protein C8Q73DRAFT_233395 [Cubamyces lactineus]|nr:hypothetical protein C8Q73DRAFT_233395 [Cubamyces lactineus]